MRVLIALDDRVGAGVGNIKVPIRSFGQTECVGVVVKRKIEGRYIGPDILFRDRILVNRRIS